MHLSETTVQKNNALSGKKLKLPEIFQYSPVSISSKSSCCLNQLFLLFLSASLYHLFYMSFTHADPLTLFVSACPVIRFPYLLLEPPELLAQVVVHLHQLLHLGF